MNGPDEVESFSDRFVDAVIDKGTVWLLVAVGALVPVLVVVQIGLAQ